MRSVRVRGGELVYEIEREGERPPAILLHPVMTTRSKWAEHIEYFSKNTVITTDFRGHGDTGETSVPTYDYGLFVEDLSALVDEVDGQPVLAGCSLGSETSLLYAREHPNEITIVASGVAPYPTLMKYFAPILVRVGRARTRLLKNTRFSRSAGPDGMTAEERLKIDNMMSGDDSLWENASLASILEGIDVPVTLVRGPSEGEFATEVVEQDHVTVEALPKGGHIASVRCPEEFVSIIERTTNSRS